MWALPPSHNEAQPRVHPKDEACIRGTEVLEQNPRETEPRGGGGVEVQGPRWRRGWRAAWGEPQGSAKHQDAAAFRWDQGLRGQEGGGRHRMMGLRAREHRGGGAGWAAPKPWRGLRRPPQLTVAEGNGGQV